MNMKNIRSMVRPFLLISGWTVALILCFEDMDVRKLVVGAIILAFGQWLGGRQKGGS